MALGRFFNSRTGEVVPADSDESAGRVLPARNGRGGYEVHIPGQGMKRVATQEAGIAKVIQESKK